MSDYSTWRKILKDFLQNKSVESVEDVYIKDGDSVRIEKRECKKITIKAEDYKNNINQQKEQLQETDWRQDYYKWKSKQN